MNWAAKPCTGPRVTRLSGRASGKRCARTLATIRLLPMDGVAASVANVRAHRFPLARPLNLVTRGSVQGLAAQFIAYARSAAVHDLIEAQFYIPIEAHG